MRVLITNIVLAMRTGTEMVVEQLADWLRQQGHTPVLYAPLVGPLGEEMRNRGHHVHDRIAQIQQPPDVIHGHHGGPTMAALAAFPGVPALFVAHSVAAEFDRPPPHPAIREVFAVSSFVRDRWASAALPAARIGLLGNAVDTARFPPRPPLPARPARAVLVAKTGGWAERVREACAKHGLHLTEAGAGVGRVSSDLPALFAGADIVFASGRSALEAAASGCAVVLAEVGWMHGLVRRAAVERLIALNWGVHALDRPADAAALAGAIAAYDATDAAQAARHVRQACALEAQGRRLLGIYEALRAAGPGEAPPGPAVAGFLESYVPSFGWDRWRLLARHFGENAMPPDLAALARARGMALLEGEEEPRPPPARVPPEQAPETQRLHAELDRLRQALAEARAIEEATRASTSWRVTAPLRKVATVLGRGRRR